MAPFSVIAFDVVLRTITVSGAKQLCFRLKTDECGRGLRELKQSTTMGMTTLPNKRFNEQKNGCARVNLCTFLCLPLQNNNVK